MIKFYYGTVGSGKSLNLISSYLNELRKRPESNVALIKPDIDTRTSGIYTRFGDMEIQPTFIYSEAKRLDWLYLLEKKKVFFIDEWQFFGVLASKDIINSIKHDQQFHIYGLRNDFLGSPWPAVQHIMNHADQIIEIETHCDICKNKKASYNKKLSGSMVNNEVGFQYIPVCRECFKTPLQQFET